MKRTMVRYTVKSDRAEENARHVAAVFEALERAQPAGLRYAVFRLEDGVSFVHIVSLEGEGNGNPLRTLPAFEAFLAGIRDRCEEAPVSAPLHELGSYRFFGG